MIDPQKALSVAQAHLSDPVLSGDPLFAAWAGGHWEAPVRVSDVFGRPSYWLVPLRIDAYVVGFVRVSATGQVLAAGTFCRDPRNPASCPKTATGISADAVLQMLRKNIVLAPGEVPGRPLFVHDGPVGREVWLVATDLDSKPHRWLFISGAGTYERPAGTVLGT